MVYVDQVVTATGQGVRSIPTYGTVVRCQIYHTVHISYNYYGPILVVIHN